MSDSKAAAVGSSPVSDKERSQSPRDIHPQQPELIPADDVVHDDVDSLGDSMSERESTASIASSILKYRTIGGRTFHSDRHDSDYFTPNDSQQIESMDLSHHALMLLLEGKLHITPLGNNVQRVLDVGTGSGIWAVDFADENPQAEVIGTDLSPIQPTWVPPNIKFEIDDCTKPWTFEESSFDFIHLRFLFGAIADWTGLFKEAYRCCKPGGWVQTGEAEVVMCSDDGTIAEDSAMKTQWNRIWREAGDKIGKPFLVISDDVQRKGMQEAGFTEIEHVTYKVPMNSWPKDRNLSEVGRYIQLTMDNDVEGYTMFIWNHVLGWPQDEYQIFLMNMRKEMRSRKIHSYFYMRYVYGRKPQTPVQD